MPTLPEPSARKRIHAAEAIMKTQAVARSRVRQKLGTPLDGAAIISGGCITRARPISPAHVDA